MIISIDHATAASKRLYFYSPLVSRRAEFDIKSNYIFWGGKYYTRTERRISYMRDKTEDGRFTF